MKRMFYFEFCVFPLKLNYDVDFKKLIKEILNESVNLNFSLLSKASFGFHIDKYLPLSLLNICKCRMDSVVSYYF